MSSTNSNTIELRNNAISADNAEDIGLPLRGEESTGVVEERKGLVAPVGHFRDNMEVVHIGESLLAAKRNRDAKRSEDRGGNSEKCNESR